MIKRLFGVMIGLVVILAFCGFVFAQATPTPAKAPEMKKAAPPKPVMYRAGGKVVAVDLKADKITIDQKAVKRERKLALRVGKKAAKQLEGISVGDVINVWVTDGTITKLVKAY